MGMVWKVELDYKEGGVSIYEVGDVILVTDENTEIEYLAMARLKDGEYRYIPLEILQNYKILNVEKRA